MVKSANLDLPTLTKYSLGTCINWIPININAIGVGRVVSIIPILIFYCLLACDSKTKRLSGPGI